MFRAIATIVCLVVISNTTLAERLPTSGTFRGVYSVNRAGVGRFSFYIVSKALKEKMAPYKGQYIEMEVVEASQPLSPGDAFVKKIGKVTRLPSPPLQVKVQKARSVNGKTVDLIYSVKNTGKKEHIFDANQVQFRMRRYPQRKISKEEDKAYRRIYETEYTRRQLEFDGELRQPFHFFWPRGPGLQTHSSVGRVRLLPGESVPFVIRDVSFPKGAYEFAVKATYYRTNNEPIPVIGTLDLDFPLSPPPARRSLLKAKAKATRDGDWLVVEGHIQSDEEDAFLFTIPGHKHHFLTGSVQTYTRSGQSLSSELGWKQPFSGLWKRTRVDREGLPFRFRLRTSNRFTDKSITKIDLWTVTDRGMEKLTVVENVEERPRRPLPPWGETSRGCRLRIQTSKASFRPDESVRISFQVESDKKEAETFRINRGNFHSHVIVTIDGKPVRIDRTQISDGHLYHFPFQGEIRVSPESPLALGKHDVKLSIQGDPGTYSNLRGDKFRQFDGKLTSNVAKFEVKALP